MNFDFCPLIFNFSYGPASFNNFDFESLIFNFFMVPAGRT